MSDNLLVILAFVGGSVLTTIIEALFVYPRTKAEVKALSAESRAVETETVGEVLASFSVAADKIVEASDRGLTLYSRALDMANIQIKSLEQRIEYLEESLDAMKQAVDQRDKLIESLKQENESLRNEMSKLEDAVKQRDKIIADLRKRLAELEKKIKEKESG